MCQCISQQDLSVAEGGNEWFPVTYKQCSTSVPKTKKLLHLGSHCRMQTFPLNATYLWLRERCSGLGQHSFNPLSYDLQVYLNIHKMAAM